MSKTVFEVGLSLAAALVLVAINGLFVAAEFAIVRVRRTRLEELAGEGKSLAKQAILLVDSVTEYLAVTQIGITAASLGVGWFGESSFARLLLLLLSPSQPPRIAVHVIATVLAFLLMTTLHVVVGELVPKQLALMRTEHLLLALTRPLQWLHVALRPLLRLFDALARWILRRLGHAEVPRTPLSEEELKLVLMDSHEEGVLTASEAQIMMRAFDFADREAGEILVAPEHVAYVSLARSFPENLAVLRRNLHARLPLCGRDLDDVIGVVGMKDCWPVLLRERSNAVFERTARPAIKVPADMRQDELLRRLQEGRGHMAIVRDHDDRHTLGIVTLEDILESLLGDVREAPLA